jgi:hypothetical protein
MGPLQTARQGFGPEYWLLSASRPWRQIILDDFLRSTDMGQAYRLARALAQFCAEWESSRDILSRSPTAASRGVCQISGRTFLESSVGFARWALMTSGLGRSRTKPVADVPVRVDESELVAAVPATLDTIEVVAPEPASVAKSKARKKAAATLPEAAVKRKSPRKVTA